MLPIERNYDFRHRYDEVHKKNRFDHSLRPAADEFVVDESTAIVVPANADDTIWTAAKDLQEYFLQSMSLSLKLYSEENFQGGKAIRYAVSSIDSEGGYTFVVTDKEITLMGNDSKGCFNASVHLEDVLNLREAPYAKIEQSVHKKLFTPRIVHSGWGIELFPNSHLNAIAHAGFDTVVVFVTDIDQTNVGVLDINDLIYRAKRYGLDVVLYSYLPAYKHPDDPGAREFFEGVYTHLFEYYPGAKGVMLVGESAEFPSRDPRTTCKRRQESIVDGIPDPKPSPGWFPCEDYPRWLQMVADAVHKAKPDALVIFNTYNWGYADDDVRREFVMKMPKDVVLQITFETFKSVKRENVVTAVMDYSSSQCDPSHYFTSECSFGHERGLRMISTANTAGLTWDFGSVGRDPVPQQWMRRFRNLDAARRNWGLSGFYDNHHYGWEASVITDLGRAYFWSPQLDMDEMLAKFAVRDFGAAAGPVFVKAWDKWSEAINYYIPSNEEQYGPMRVGPSYPFIFRPNITRTMSNKEIRFPTKKGAHFGWGIIKTFYEPYENVGQTPGALRHPVELRSLEKMKALWTEGLQMMTEALPMVPEHKRETAEREINLGEYILANITTGIHMKRWYMLNTKLTTAETAAEMNAILDQLEEIATAEEENARHAIPVVERDSRLGWEPSMEYVTDRWHIEWKLRQMASMRLELADYRKSINLA